ncbi:MAG: hypothetical protein IJH55_05710 [Romboutsia sp.]|nr:hypothetical protein [Romboutsia sp.]
MTNNNGVQNQPFVQNIIDFETEGNYFILNLINLSKFSVRAKYISISIVKIG